jgi:hypothetical protein
MPCPDNASAAKRRLSGEGESGLLWKGSPFGGLGGARALMVDGIERLHGMKQPSQVGESFKPDCASIRPKKEAD